MSKKTFFLVFLFALLACSSTVPTTRLTPQRTLAVTASVAVTGSGASLYGDVLSLNLEMSDMCEVLSLDAANPAYYEQLYKNLGSDVIHLGGHSADMASWQPMGSAACSASGTVLTQAQVDAFFAFARAIGWHVIWKLPLIPNDPASAASEASYVAASGGSTLLAFSIGNEPELYVQNGFRPAGWGEAQFAAEWSGIERAVLAVLPTAKFIGPDACCNASQIYTPDANAEASDPALLTLTHHFYLSSFLPKTQDSLLSAQADQLETTNLTNWMATASADNKPFEVSETNSFGNGGVDGVTNSMAAALWLTDYTLLAASLHVRRVDVQMARGAFYDLIDDSGQPTALYYGMLLAHTMLRTARFDTVALSSTGDLTAYALAAQDGSLRIVLINKDPGTAMVALNPGGTYTSASSFALIAPSVSSTTGITLGTRTVSVAGTWSAHTTPVVLSGGQATVTIPPYSALAVTFVP